MDFNIALKKLNESNDDKYVVTSSEGNISKYKRDTFLSKTNKWIDFYGVDFDSSSDDDEKPALDDQEFDEYVDKIKFFDTEEDAKNYVKDKNIKGSGLDKKIWYNTWENYNLDDIKKEVIRMKMYDE